MSVGLTIQAVLLFRADAGGMSAHSFIWKAAARTLSGVVGAVALLSLALPAAAQDKVWRVGLLTAGNERPENGVRQSWLSGVLLSLDRSGYLVGKNLELVGRYTQGNVARLPDLAGEIAAANVDVVVAIGDSSVRAMQEATRTMPIVMLVGADPVMMGLVASLARPGGRVTGLAIQTFEGGVKRLELFREAMPNGRRFGYLRPPGPVPARAAELLLEAARRLDVELTIRSVDRLETTAYEAAFAAICGEGDAGVLRAMVESW